MIKDVPKHVALVCCVAKVPNQVCLTSKAPLKHYLARKLNSNCIPDYRTVDVSFVRP